MRWTLCFVAVLAFAVSAGEPAAAPSPAAPKKKKWQELKADMLVSDTALLYVSTNDMKKALGAFDRTSFRAMLREEDVGKPVLSALQRLREAYIAGDGTRSELDLRRRSDEIDLLTKLAPLMDGHVAVAVEPEAGGKGDLLDRFLVVMSMPLDGGEDRQRQIEDIMEKHRASQCTDSRFRDGDDLIADHLITRVECSELNLIESWSFVENLFIYGKGKRIVEDAIDRFSRRGEGALVSHKGSQYAIKEVGADETVTVYMQADLRPVITRMKENNPALVAMFRLEELAVEANRPHVALGLAVPPGENQPVREKIFVRLNQDALPKGDLANSASSARFTPGDALAYVSVAAQGGDAYNWLLGTVRGAEKDKAVPFDERLKTVLGAGKEADLRAKLDGLKGEMGFSLSYLPLGSGELESLSDLSDLLQPVFFLEIDKDNGMADSAVRNSLSELARASGHEYITTRVQGTGGGKDIDVFYQRGLAPREEKMGTSELGLFRNLQAPPPAKPGQTQPDAPAASVLPFFGAYAIVAVDADGAARRFVLLSDSLNAVKKAVQMAQAQFSRSSLAEEKAFRDQLGGFRDKPSAVLYADLKRITEVAASEMPRITKAAGLSRDSIDQFPNVSTIKDFMAPMSLAVSSQKEPSGLLVESSSPVGNLPLVAVTGSLAWPAIVARQQMAVSAESTARFQKLQLALHLYAADFDRFPAQLSDLYDAYVRKDELKLFESPFKRNVLKGSTQEIDSPDLTNLVYVPGRSLQGLGGEVVVYEKEPTRILSTRDGIKTFYHVVTVDGKKSFMTRAQLERSLAGRAEIVTTNVGDGVVAPRGKALPSPATRTPPARTPPKAPAPRR